MKRAIVFALMLTALVSKSQQSDNFKVGNYAEVLKDKIKVFLNSDGKVSSQSCATFYREGKMAATVVGFDGEFSDYYLNGKPMLNTSMKKGMLDGTAKYFYNNGNIWAEGFYSENLRDGKWVFYFENGKIEKIINFTKGKPEIVDAFNESGKQTVKNGNGRLETAFNYPDQAGKNFISSGEIQDGKMNGRWQFTIPGQDKPIGYEEFKSGSFISGFPQQYTDWPRISVIRYYPNENVRWFDNISSMCPSTTKRIVMYNGWGPTRGYFKELENRLTKEAKGMTNQWFFVGLKISKSNRIKDINVASSLNDQPSELLLSSILKKMTNWEAARDQNGPVDSEIYFTVFVNEGTAHVPSQIVYDRFLKETGLK